MSSFFLPPDCQQLLIRPWRDPVVDELGHDPRSPYAERFWLGLLGPSSLWFVRYTADRFDTAADQFHLDLATCASALGLGRGNNRARALTKTLGRCCAFNVARMLNRRTLEVRQRLAPLSNRQLSQLCDPLRLEHDIWVHQHPNSCGEALLTQRARRMALSLLNLGEDGEATELQLERWHFPRHIAQAAAGWATDLWSDNAALAPG